MALLLAASAMGVDYGWRPHEEGGVEYIIQIEPEVFASLQAGGDIVSEIHPEAGDVRRFRIRVGRGTLPREEAKAAAADDGPLPPAPPGDEVTSGDDATPGALSSSTKNGGAKAPPLNHVAQGSGYGGAFGGYSGGYTRSSGASSPSTATSGASGSYGGARTSSDYSGSTRNGYTEYTGAAGTGPNSAPANSSAPAGSNAVAGGAPATRGDEAWSRGEVRTAANQPTVTSSSSNNNATTAATSNSGQYASQPATNQPTSTQQPPNAATGVSTTSGQTQPAYGANTAGTYRGTRDYSTTTGDGASSHQGQTGSLTPISDLQNSRSGAATNSATSNQNIGDQSRWTAAPAARQQDQGIAPPPAYPQGGPNDPSTGATATAANGNYGNAGYNNNYNNQYPPGAAPPLLAPAAPQGNYGYVPAGYPPYQPAAQPGYGYGQAPGYYAMPSISPPVLTASAANASESSSRSRSRRDEEEEEEEQDYRDRRPATTVAAAAPALPAAQANVVTSEPWLAFTITIVLLFASIGGNIYLLWISQDFYWRYKELANDLRASAAS
jgi:hypothetical protein